MLLLILQGLLNVTCVSVRGYLARELSSKPPNITPVLNEIGTIAGARISPKRLDKFKNNLRHVVAGAKGYKEKYWSLGTNRGY